MEHRLPENHDCRGQPPRTPLGYWEPKNTIGRARKHKWGNMESEGEFHSKKKTPFSYKTERRPYRLERIKRRLLVGKIVSVVTGVVGFLIIGLIIGFIFGGLGGLITSSISIS